MAEKKAELLKKITIGTCGAQPTMEIIAKLEKHGGRADLLDVFGIVTKYKPEASDKGPYVRFYGQFKAVNLLDKKEYTSSVFIAPKMIEEPLWAVIKPEGENNVRFGFRIGVKFDKKAATKYVYAAEDLLPPSDDNQLALLESEVREAVKALPAPK